MSRIGLDTALAAVVAVWFIVAGSVALLARPPAAGRRALATPGLLARRLRGGLEVVGGLAVAAGFVIAVLGIHLPFPGRFLGLGLAVLALWEAAEATRKPVGWSRLAMATLGFVLAVYYSGFRD